MIEQSPEGDEVRSVSGNVAGGSAPESRSVGVPATGEQIEVTNRSDSDQPSAISGFFYYLAHNRMLAGGIVMLVLLLGFWGVGSVVVDPAGADPLAGPPSAAPMQDAVYFDPMTGERLTVRYLLGTDSNGRQILPLMIHGAPLTLRIGLVAGVVGLLVGTVFGFLGGYMRGAIDTVLRVLTDVWITIPGLAVLVVIASTVARGEGLSVTAMGLIVALLSWMWPARVIRAQVLSMRESNYVEVARLNGMGNLEIVFRELMPNLLPFLAASFVGAIASSILAAVGLEALGLGPQSEPTLGMTIYWSIYFGALLNNWWWWWLPPVVLLAWIFVTLFLIAGGLDEWANPRLRQSL